ncbi:MAG: hypothetical protein IPL23_13280 [Saprospiraceae bacterium]|nr:hypothetical protein [Saprospiraceae bacterium]
MAFTTIPAVGISGLTSISVNTQGGNDKIIIDSFSTSLPNLTINGGLGDDTLNFKGNITLIPGANLDVDMQNDEINPGLDNVLFSTNAKISLVGLGTAIIKVSRNISFSANSSLLTEDGNITLEANQQTLPSNGNFSGIDVNGSVIQNTGNGLILIKGMGGNAGFKNTGVNVQNGGQIIGGQTGSVEVSGTGGISSEDANMGVRIYNTNSAITSIGGDVIVIGKGGGSGMSISNVGVMLQASGQISAGSMGMVKVTGSGGASENNGNYGVFVTNFNSRIISSGGDVNVIGNGGGIGDSYNNHGVVIASGGEVSAGGLGSVSLEGTGATSIGYGHFGVVLININSKITSAGGNVKVVGMGGGSGASSGNNGVSLYFSCEISAGGMGQ